MKTRIVISVIVLLVHTSLYAFNWADHKVSVVNSETKENETTLHLKSSDNTSFTVRHTGDFDDKFGPTIIQLNNIFRSWKHMKVDKINFVIIKDKLQIVVVPSSYVYKKTDILSKLPAGMLFNYGDIISYNFRINVENLFIRIKGKFLNEEILSKKIVRAIEDPISYLTSYNTKFLFKKLMNHQAAIDKLTKDLSGMKNKYDKLLNAVLTIHNTGFLGFGKTEINKKAIERIIELRKGDPTLKKGKIADILEKEKIKATGQEIDLVLNVFFNEFED